MSNQELRLLIKNEIQYLKFKTPKSRMIVKNVYKKHHCVIDIFNKDNDNIPYDEKVYCYINKISKRPVCLQCNSLIKFYQFIEGYYKFCCGSCANTYNKLFSFDYVLKKSNEKHNYKFLYDQSTYIDSVTPMKIICPIHGEFWQTPSAHITGKYGCRKCSAIETGAKLIIPLEEIKLRFTKTHENKNYTYFWETYIKSNVSMKIKCNICNSIFWQWPSVHKSGCGCPKCKRSKGEIKIENFLINNIIKFESQKKFDGCKNKYSLPFDFYLTKQNVCIEYDGEMHYKSIEHFGGIEHLNYVKNNDKIKTEYCQNNNIRLIRIPYWEKNDIGKILIKIL